MAAPRVPEADAAERVGRVYINADGLGDAGPVLAGRTTVGVQEALVSESVTLTDAPAGPELRIVMAFRDAGGYRVDYEIVYDGDVMEDGGFDCQLCTEDEMVGKVVALARQVAPMMVVPTEEEATSEIDPVPGETPEGSGGGGTEDTVTPVEPNRALRGAGIGLLAAGGASIVTGVVLFVVPEGTEPATSGPQNGKYFAPDPMGGLLLGAGIALAAGGAVCLGIYAKQKKQAKSTAFHPWFGPGGGGLAVTGRF